jgi:hypothetical protein
LVSAPLKNPLTASTVQSAHHIDHFGVKPMNNQEREQLSRLLNQLGEIKLSTQDKDLDAEQLIHTATANQPDAGYLLVQRTLLLEQALQAAKTQITDLQNQLQNRQPAAMSNFLDNDPWGQVKTKSSPVPGADGYAIPQSNQQPPISAFGGGASSFLGNVATTAAGVVAGSFLMQGLGSLIGHHSSPWGHQAANSREPATGTAASTDDFNSDNSESASIHNADFQVEDDDTLQDGNDSDWI